MMFLPPPPPPPAMVFIDSMQDGSRDLRGVYVNGVFALPVVPQPVGEIDFVSPRDNVLTQFQMPVGIGLLAHDFLSGRYFTSLHPGQFAILIYGDHTALYEITAIRSYQSLPSGDYIDLETNAKLSTQDLFNLMYAVPNQLVFQTCIDRNGDSLWGRLFIIANPIPIEVINGKH